MKPRRVLLVTFVCAAVLLCAVDAHAQKLDLSVSPTVITFASADPETTPSILAPPIVVSARVRQVKGNSPWLLTVLANGDLISGTQTVDITNVTWAATPAPPFQNGTLSKTVAQQVAAGTGNLTKDGSLTFRLANSWNYAAGTYTQTIVFTLSAP
jgi:hypothetical protein